MGRIIEDRENTAGGDVIMNVPSHRDEKTRSRQRLSKEKFILRCEREKEVFQTKFAHRVSFWSISNQTSNIPAFNHLPYKQTEKFYSALHV